MIRHASSLLVCFLPRVLSFDPTVFPLSTREALIQKSKNLNGSTQYSSQGWSNRAATVVTPVSESIYTIDRPFYWNNIDVGCRCTIIEIPSKGKDKPDLWVHSPVNIDGPLQKVLQEMGTVKYAISPNYEHLKFAPAWHRTYPDAEMWGNPGLAERLTEISWAGEIDQGYRPTDWKSGPSKELPWGSDIQALHIDCEVNPFTNKPFFNEVVYYHVPSKTLLTTDFFWNYPITGPPNAVLGRTGDAWELAPSVEVPLSTRAWKFGMDKVYYPFFQGLMIAKQRETYQELVDHILNKWEVETVIPAHGDILRGKEFVQSTLRTFFKAS